MFEIYTRDPGRTCPDCASAGYLRYAEIPESTLTYTKDGEEFTEHMGESRDYRCMDCDCTFILTEWSE
ncbi:hypothetical protein [Dyella sp. ASV21]|uniref:hypothetical protein n=1 Tax=Dyella sp. ASV21 TaxID=2795114 RepID=UPI0018ECCEC5|nr:hypothetical protein [Dyella sp. ASV21]